jgi:hypothetical protein
MWCKKHSMQGAAVTSLKLMQEGSCWRRSTQWFGVSISWVGDSRDTILQDVQHIPVSGFNRRPMSCNFGSFVVLRSQATARRDRNTLSRRACRNLPWLTHRAGHESITVLGILKAAQCQQHDSVPPLTSVLIDVIWRYPFCTSPALR